MPAALLCCATSAPAEQGAGGLVGMLAILTRLALGGVRGVLGGRSAVVRRCGPAGSGRGRFLAGRRALGAHAVQGELRPGRQGV